MTWGEFKTELERQGVADTDIVEYIDVNCGYSLNSMPEIWATLEVNENRPRSFSVSS